MPKGRVRGTLASLEQQLTQLDGQRRAIVAAIRAAVEHMVHGSGATPASARGTRAEAAVRQPRKISPEVRERLSKLARERWAKAKKAGKTRLG